MQRKTKKNAGNKLKKCRRQVSTVQAQHLFKDDRTKDKSCVPGVRQTTFDKHWGSVYAEVTNEFLAKKNLRVLLQLISSTIVQTTLVIT